MRLLYAAGLAIGLLGGVPRPAAAVEIVAITPQINPKSDAVNSVNDTAIVEDDAGGFTAVWSKSRSDFEAARELYARSFDDALKPAGAARQFDQPIDGAEITGIRIAGGLALSKDRIMVGWEALFFGAQPHNPEFVGSTLKGDRAQGALAPIDDTPGFMTGCRIIGLSDGRGLAYWTYGGDANKGRFIERDGKLGGTLVDINVGNAFLARPGVVALASGFAAFFGRRTAVSSELEIVVQTYGPDGLPDGAPFVIIPASPPSGILGAVGLANGKLAVLRLINGDDGRGVITGRVFNRAGKEAVGTTRMVKNLAFNSSLPMLALDGGGFLLAVDDGSLTSTRLAVLRFGDGLKPIGPVAVTKRFSGLRRSAVRMLADGRAAVSFVIEGRRIFVAIVEP